MRLLGRPTSINVRKVIWTAAEAGLALSREDDWADSRDVRTPAFQALNPNALVPVLVTDEGALWESNSICRYLAALAPDRLLLPAAPFSRAQTEKWMDWQQTELNTAWRAAFMGLVRRHPDFRDDGQAISQSASRWNGLMLILDRVLEDGGPYVAGADFTLADIVLGLSHQRWLLTPINRPPAPALAAWRARLMARPAAPVLDWDCP